MPTFSCREHVVEKCPRCQGIWFTGRSFGSFRDTLREFDLGKIKFSAGLAGEAPEIIGGCPRCPEILIPFRYAYNSRVRLLRCEKCGGFWLTYPELLNLLNLAKISQDIAPHVSAATKEIAKLKEGVERDRRVASAMNGLKKLPWW